MATKGTKEHKNTERKRYCGIRCSRHPPSWCTKPERLRKQLPGFSGHLVESFEFSTGNTVIRTLCFVPSVLLCLLWPSKTPPSARTFPRGAGMAAPMRTTVAIEQPGWRVSPPGHSLPAVTGIRALRDSRHVETVFSGPAVTQLWERRSVTPPRSSEEPDIDERLARVLACGLRRGRERPRPRVAGAWWTAFEPALWLSPGAGRPGELLR
jgi:hypothetical protein